MERLVNALIVDDDESARSILQKYLEVADNVNIVGNVSTTDEAMTIIRKAVPDIIFLDIHFPDGDGLKFAECIRNEGIDLQIVFTTAHREYAAKAFHIHPLDYLLKPFGMHEIFDVVTKIEAVLKANSEPSELLWGYKIPDKLKFNVKGGYYFCEHANIVYIKTSGIFAHVYTNKGEIKKVAMSLGDIFEDIKHLKFIRLGRSVVVNLNYLIRLDRKTKKCYLNFNNQEIGFSVTGRAFKLFELMKSVKIG